MMESILESLKTSAPDFHTAALLRAAIALTVGLSVATVIRRWKNTAQPTHILSLRRGTGYAIVVLTIAIAMRELGFNLSTLLGAAGLLTIAFGFAAQTAVSNVISGLFLVSERPFSLGDTVQVANTTGQVISIDLLSVKLRTFANLVVRIPNETMLKSELVNLTQLPIRRCDMKLNIGYQEDLDRVREVLSEVADQNHICLEEPCPLFQILEFGNSAVEAQFSVWASTPNYYTLRTSMHADVKMAFDQAGIHFPYPQLSVHTQQA